jgi:undecaprenyl-diphosphatase
MASGYLWQLVALLRLSFLALVQPPSDPHRRQAAQRLLWQVLWFIVIGAVVIVALIFGFDAAEIGMMPPRGTKSLWPVRILTDFGKDEYILWLLFAALIVIVLVAPLLQEGSRTRLQTAGARLGYLFLAVQVPVLAGEAIKWVVGRGRPFVGGKADAFNFVPFTGHEPYFSFPSSHTTTAFALAVAVAAIWPRTRIIMLVYAVVIAATRLVLLAHHPSDVVAGALVGSIGALCVRYWFASRRLGFEIAGDGRVLPPANPPLSTLKRVAEGAPGP